MVTSDISLDESRDWDFDKSYLSSTSLDIPDKEVDPYAMAQKSFAERVSLLETKNNLSTYLVDQRILVQGPSDAMRGHAIKNWEDKKDTAIWWSTFHIVALFGSISLTALTATTLPLIAIAGAVNAIASLRFWTNNNLRAAHAKIQIGKWDMHPAQSVADMRAKTYSSSYGFLFAITNQLKGSSSLSRTKNILHPSEVTWLYEQALTGLFKDTVDKTSLSDQAKWVDRFVTQNLLSFQSIDYAYETFDHKKLTLGFYAPFFEIYKQNVLEAAAPFTEQANSIRSKARLKIERLQKQILVPYFIPNPGLYSPNYTPYQVVYIQQPNLNYDHDKKEIEKWESVQLTKIQQAKELELSSYFARGRSLLNSAYINWGKQIDIPNQMNREF